MKIRPRRSVLYMPGASDRALEKARNLPADALILDLEDSVAPEAKSQARDKVVAAVKGGGYGARELIIRVNALDTPWGADDLKAAASVAADAILVPKVSRPGDMVSAAKLLKAQGAPAQTRLWAMMETPLAILNARDIAGVAADADSRFSCLVLGTNDLVKESRARALGDRFAIIPWLAMSVLAARSFGLDVIDGVYNDFKDDAGFRAECEQGRTLGMDGKTLIHPSQIDPCNQIFSPTDEEVQWSRKVIQAFALKEHKGKGVITVEGRMVERLHLVMAERVVAIWEAIAR
jgi:citrate lyase subunit beta / citryl-CoA lyase